MVEPRDAATLLLVRDAPEAPSADASRIEVFMLRRNHRSAFVAGAYVFPGGAVDREDRAAETFALVDGIDDATASARMGYEHGGLAFWVAAIRETFEEAGVLLARDHASGAAINPEIAAGLDHERAPVASGDRSFAALIADQGLVLDGGALRVLSRWITPSPAPRRYDTWFFVAPAPPDHTYVHDDDETVASEWLGATAALERSRTRSIDLIYPTFRTLQAIERFPSCAHLFAALDAAWRRPATEVMGAMGGVSTNGWQVPLPGDELAGRDQEADARAHSVTAASTTASPTGGR
jgi:8-oxo-dGTP pyrophosphatase MutT (NUDIX family)